jgi:phosphatidylglycerol:prolipoprotein diacylglycerol transferase
MIYIHNIDPILFSIGFIDLYWYGAMYAISFLLLDYLMKKEVYLGNSNFDIAIIDKILLISIFSLLIGGRLGYVIFYNLDYYYLNFHKIFYIWEGGMSFHGALLGILLGILFVSIKERINFFKLSDFIVVFIPLGLLLGRIGNFINSELYGMPTNGNWGVIFSKVDSIPRHPSMLYEAFLEGLVLFIILKSIYNKKPKTGKLTSLFLIYYAFFRCLVEFVRVPDIQIGYLYKDWFTMGMFLSIPMFLIGLFIYYLSIQGKIER